MNLVLPEIVSVGIYHSKVAEKSRKISKNRKTTMFEIEMPLEEGGVSYINQEEMPIRPGLIICAKPGQMRHTKFPFKCLYIHMIVREGILYDELIQMQNYIETNEAERCFAILEKLSSYTVESVDYDMIRMQSLVLELISFLIQTEKKRTYCEQIKSNHYASIEQAMRYIDEHFDSDLSLNVIAEQVGFSPVHFHNVFKASTGKTLRAYVEERRIQKAVNLLLTTDQTLTQIAYACGFSSQSYFSYAFKRKMHLTPRDYVKAVVKRYEAN